jgi:hypothetical protein
MKTFLKTQKIISFLLIAGFIIPSVLILPAHRAEAQSSSTWVYSIIGADGVTRESNQYQSLTSCQTDLATPAFPGESHVGPCVEVVDVEAQAASLGSGSTPKPGSVAAEALTSKGCTQLLGQAFASLFKKKVKDTLKDQGTQTAADEEGVPISNKFFDAKLKAINDDTASTKQSTGYLMKKGGCLDSIAKIVIKNMIAYITTSLIHWINTGFEGKPFYLENPDGFFKNIAKNQFLEFGNGIKDASLFPFGKNFIKGAALAFNRKFESNAQYSLNKLIAKTNPGKTGVDFSANFNIGGWDAYLGMTAPQNNPIGFNIAAANELSVRLDGTQTSKANQIKESLQQAGGFLGDERCAEPNASPRITHQEDAAARRGETGARICNRWEYVTPGGLIADKLTSAANSPEKRLEIADDLNSALAALADALIAKGITTLTNKGLKALGQSSDNPSAWDDGVTNNSNSQTYGGTQFPDFYITPGSWISNHPDFNLSNGDLTQAIVDEQRTYMFKIQQYSDAMQELIKWVRQLDYCIPGPNPNWEEAASANLDRLSSNSKDPKNPFDDPTLGQIASILDPSGISSIFIGLHKEKAAKEAAGNALEKILHVNIDDNQDQIDSQAGVIGVINGVYNSYKAIIDSIYFKSNLPYMPSVTQEARAEFAKIPSYGETIDNNDQEIAFRKGIVKRLQSFKDKIDSGQISQADLNNPTSSAITEFARLSQYLVDGDDIANMDNLFKETVDETNYVHDNLIGGQFGCEQELADLWNPAGKTAAEAQADKKMYITYVGNREPYPLSIDHFIWRFGTGGPYNDPNWNPSQYTTQVNEGFLYGAGYGNSWAGYPITSCVDSATGLDRFVGNVLVSALDEDGHDIGGLNTTTDPKNACGVVLWFEKSFGIY